MEEELKAYLRKQPADFSPTMRIPFKEFSVDFRPWLGSEDRSNLDWDHYRHGDKQIDLVGVDRGEVILFELKAGAGSADEAPLQSIEYWHALQLDRKAIDRLSTEIGTEVDVRSSSIYIVVAGHISALFWKRLSLLRAGSPSPNVKVFQAIPPKMVGFDGSVASNWRIYPVVEP